MKIHLHFFATYRELVGFRNLTLDVNERCDVQTVTELFLEAYPHMRQHWLDQAGNWMPHVFVILNKLDVNSLPDGCKTILQPGDELDFLPPVGGG